MDYRLVDILPGAVVYCDIPYKGTNSYGEFDHKQFFDWAASRPFPVYVSEYNILDSRFKCVYKIDKLSLMCAQKSRSVMSEKLYWNQVTGKEAKLG